MPDGEYVAVWNGERTRVTLLAVIREILTGPEDTSYLGAVAAPAIVALLPVALHVSASCHERPGHCLKVVVNEQREILGMNLNPHL